MARSSRAVREVRKRIAITAGYSNEKSGERRFAYVGVAAPTLDLGYCYRRMSWEKVQSRGGDLHFFTNA